MSEEEEEKKKLLCNKTEKFCCLFHRITDNIPLLHCPMRAIIEKHYFQANWQQNCPRRWKKIMILVQGREP